MTSNHSDRALTLWGLISGILSIVSGGGSSIVFGENINSFPYFDRYGQLLWQKANNTHSTCIFLIVLGCVLIVGSILKHFLHLKLPKTASKIIMIIGSCLVLVLSLLCCIPVARFMNYI